MTNPPVAVEIEVTNEHGLHLRPAAQFVRLAAVQPAGVRVTNLTRNPARSASARSLLELTGLGIDRGHRIRLDAEGEGATASAAALRDLVAGGFEDS